ncbi:MAG: hypothetical protein JW730_16315 [Anaerolineales bacterium]|nr:hypothetical protein [Anaerolineales bacterium]
MTKTFVQLVKQHFEYLVLKYNFDLLVSTESPRGHPWEGRVEYVTKLTFIDIDCTRGESPMIHVSRMKDLKRYPVSLDTIYEYHNLSEEEKEIIVTRTPDKEFQRKASEILYSKRLSRCVLISTNETDEKKMDFELSLNAKHLFQYAEPFLRGDFSRWLEIYEYQVGKMWAEIFRSGKSEFVLYRAGSDARGKPVYEKRLVFQDSIDYLESLKEEYRKK